MMTENELLEFPAKIQCQPDGRETENRLLFTARTLQASLRRYVENPTAGLADAVYAAWQDANRLPLPAALAGMEHLISLAGSRELQATTCAFYEAFLSGQPDPKDRDFITPERARDFFKKLPGEFHDFALTPPGTTWPVDLGIKPLTPRQECVVRAMLSSGTLGAMTGEQIIEYVYGQFKHNMDLSTFSAVLPALKANGIPIENRKGAGYYIADPRVREYLAKAFPPIPPTKTKT